MSPEFVIDLMKVIERNTVPANGQRALSVAEQTERVADWIVILQAQGVSEEDFKRAALAAITSSKWRPELADILAHIAPPASREDIAATAADDLAYLLAGYRLCGSIDEIGALTDAILPAEGQPLRTRPVISEVVVPNRFGLGHTVKQATFAYPPCPADLAARHDRIRAALGRIGGLEEVRRVMRAEDDGRALAGLGHSWRAVYASNASEAQRAASPGLRVIEGGKRGEAAMLARRDERDTGRMVQEIAGMMRGPR